ncbi:hypothetical protein BH23ACT6_BH23ACT6_15470 [soil metagenome]
MAKGSFIGTLNTLVSRSPPKNARALLGLITGPGSVALNHAAMSSPELSAQLLASGRRRIGPIVEAYLAELHTAGSLHAPDPPAAFCTFYGLVIQDSQIRTLLGEQAPSAEQIQQRARGSVNAFLTLSQQAGSAHVQVAAEAGTSDRSVTIDS